MQGKQTKEPLFSHKIKQEFKMKKNVFLTGLIISAILLSVFITGCADPNDPNNQSVGSITFSDGLPSGTWAVYVTSETVTSFITGADAMAKYVAAGAHTWVSGNKVYLISEGSTGTFNENGTYNIVIYDTTDPYKLHYKSSVKFNGGDASFARSTMTVISS